MLTCRAASFLGGVIRETLARRMIYVRWQERSCLNTGNCGVLHGLALCVMSSGSFSSSTLGAVNIKTRQEASGSERNTIGNTLQSSFEFLKISFLLIPGGNNKLFNTLSFELLTSTKHGGQRSIKYCREADCVYGSSLVK